MSKPMIDVIEDFPGIPDQFHVANPDSNYYYCWINAKPDNVEKMKSIWGYEVVGSGHKEGALVPPNAAGERKIGDVVLARMPRERYEKIMRLKKRKAEAQIAAATDAWKDSVASTGLKVDDTTKRTSEVFKVE